MDRGNNMYSVYVGGTEVSDYYMSKEDAEYQAFLWREDGYDDVEIISQPIQLNKSGG